MPEYVVDCDEVPYGDRLLVLPLSFNGHVREHVVRCRDCEHCRVFPDVAICYRRALGIQTSPDGFCDKGKRRDGDGKPS